MERSEEVRKAVSNIIDDIHQRMGTNSMSKSASQYPDNDPAPKPSPSIGTVHGTAIVADHVTIQTLNSAPAIETEPISPAQVVELDAAVTSITESDPRLSKESVWNDLFTALNVRGVIPLIRFDEAKAILAQRASKTVEKVVSALRPQSN